MLAARAVSVFKQHMRQLKKHSQAEYGHMLLSQNLYDPLKFDWQFCSLQYVLCNYFEATFPECENNSTLHHTPTLQNSVLTIGV